ncbi:MAG: CDP-glycerol glycerophosphotransferase family protein [Microgenomates group bacterium]
MVKIIKTALKAYRPIDRQMRQFPIYEKLSNGMYGKLRPFLNSLRKSQGGANTEATRAYTEGLGTVPVNENAILFESYWGKKIADHPLAIFRAFTAHYPIKNYKVFWTLRAGVVPPVELKKYPHIIYIDPETEAYGAALLEAKYLFNNVTFPTFFIRQPNQKYCNTWHGVPMKAMGRDMNAPFISMANTQRNFLQSDVLLRLGAYYEDATITPYHIKNLVHDHLFDVGSPRFDDTLHSKIDDATLRKKYGITSEQKIVLFAPTWRGNSTQIADSFTDQYALFKQVSMLLGTSYFVLFSAHQMVNVPSGIVHKAGALLSEEDNINDIMTIVDILVSDYSSIIFDFLPLDRPLVLFTPDLDAYCSERGLYVLPNELPCQTEVTVDGLVKAIQRGKRPSDFDNHQISINKFVPNDSGAESEKALRQMFSPANVLTIAAPPPRQRLLIGPGGMVPNGITSSLKNLISNLDYDRYDPYIIVDASIMDGDSARMEQFGDFHKKCNWILRCGDLMLKGEEAEIYKKFRLGSETFSEAELNIVRAIFQRENQRVLGNATFDVAIEFGGYAPYWAALIACVKADRHVIYQHNHLWAEASNPNPDRNQKQLLSVFNTYRWFDAVVAVSDETRDVNNQHLSRFYRKGVAAVTVQNTMNFAAIKTRSEIPLVYFDHRSNAIVKEPGVVKFIALGRLSPEKRYDRMINAFAKIAAENRNAVLFICGDGPLKASLAKLVQIKNVGEQVILLGRVSNPYPLLAHCDFCVMSSDYEGQPMALLEALSFGIPCIGTDIPGIRAVLKDGKGMIVPANETALAAAMQDAITHGIEPPQNVDMEAYVASTMRQFYTKVCGAT